MSNFVSTVTGQPIKNMEELAVECLDLESALMKAFPTVHFEPDGMITVKCCGHINYGSGILGTDIVECYGCGRMMFHVLSPHVSPFLRIGNSSVGIPDDATFELFGEKVWFVYKPEEDRV